MKWTEDKIKYLIDNYQTTDNKEIALSLGCTEISVGHKACRLGIKRNKSNIRKYHFNENYFDTLTQTGAYILGYTMADGCINTSKKNHYRISYHINPQDIEILDLIRTELKLTQKYRFNNTLNKQTNKRYVSVQLQFSSQKIYNALQRYGICNRKTGLESIDNIPKEFLLSFILGYFDGDGCCSISSNGRYQFKIVSANKIFLEAIQAIFNGLGRVSNHSSIYSWSVTGISNIASIGRTMYKNTNIGLSRKKNRMLQVIERDNNEC